MRNWYAKVKTPFFSSDKREKLEFLQAIVGHKNSDKVPVPLVVPMVEESFILPRRPHARTVRSRQWQIVRGDPVVEKKLWRGG